MRFLLFRVDGQNFMALAQVDLNRRATGEGAPGVGICVRGPILWPRRWCEIKIVLFLAKMMRFLLFRVYGQKCMVFDGLGFTVQKCTFFAF